MRKLFAILALLTLPLFGRAAEQHDKPNIIVILADDYGWGSLGCYGAPDDLKTPNLDRLAKEGRRFTNAYAPGSVCSPTRYGLMTGRYYWRTNVKDGKVLPGNGPLHIEKNRLTLASLCKSQGYRTAAFGKWHLGLTTDRVTDWSAPLTPGPLQVGFDHFFGMAANIGNGPHSFIEDEALSGRMEGQPVVVERGGGKGNNTTSGIEKPWEPDQIVATLTENVTNWIEKNKDDPFFVYYAPNAVHEPMVPNPKFTGSKFGKYGDFIDELDWSVGQILKTLDRFKLADNTLIIFTSDNGGVVNPGNPNATGAIKAGLAINGPLRGGKHGEWEGGFREPFLVRWPGKVPADTVSDQVICLTDVLATLAGIFHAPLPPGNAEDSFDVLRAFMEELPGSPVRDHVVLQSAGAVYDIRMGDWKLVERADAPQFETKRNKKKTAQAVKKKRAAPSKDELYNLRNDPAEETNVAAKHAKRVAELKSFLVAAREQGFTRAGADDRKQNGTAASTAAKSQADKENWIQLFDGKTLKGWHKNPKKGNHGTGGAWSVEADGVLAGEQDPPGSGNGGILLTDRKFGDFELELEMKPHWGSDSGVFLRSTDKGQCIQMTVDYYNNGNIGHMYGEASGGWSARAFSVEGTEESGKLTSLKAVDVKLIRESGLVESCKPEEWLKVWKIGDWNKCRIRVEGGRLPKITTYINGLKVGVFDAATSNAESYDKEKVADLLGDKGSIALQVHGGNSYPPGAKCRWRNIRVREL